MQKGGNVKNVKMFCALLASNDERTLHLLAPPGDNLRCALRANSCCPSHTQSLTHSLISSPFWPYPFGGCQAKCSHKYVNVQYVSVPEMPAATANQAKWLHSQSCHRPHSHWPPPTLTSHAPFDVALCATCMCIHQLALTLARISHLEQ